MSIHKKLFKNKLVFLGVIILHCSLLNGAEVETESIKQGKEISLYKEDIKNLVVGAVGLFVSGFMIPSAVYPEETNRFINIPSHMIYFPIWALNKIRWASILLASLLGIKSCFIVYNSLKNIYSNHSS